CVGSPDSAAGGPRPPRVSWHRQIKRAAELPLGREEPMPNSRAEWMAAIMADPENDAPRLVFSDWLEEQGESQQAEFIRVECEMARIHDAPGNDPNPWEFPRFWELHRRARELRDAFAAQWFAPLYRVFQGEVRTRRGFPWHIALSARRFVQQGEA